MPLYTQRLCMEKTVLLVTHDPTEMCIRDRAIANRVYCPFFHFAVQSSHGHDFVRETPMSEDLLIRHCSPTLAGIDVYKRQVSGKGVPGEIGLPLRLRQQLPPVLHHMSSSGG